MRNVLEDLSLELRNRIPSFVVISDGICVTVYRLVDIPAVTCTVNDIIKFPARLEPVNIGGDEPLVSGVMCTLDIESKVFRMSDLMIHGEITMVYPDSVENVDSIFRKKNDDIISNLSDRIKQLKDKNIESIVNPITGTEPDVDLEKLKSEVVSGFKFPKFLICKYQNYVTISHVNIHTVFVDNNLETIVRYSVKDVEGSPQSSHNIKSSTTLNHQLSDSGTIINKMTKRLTSDVCGRLGNATIKFANTNNEVMGEVNDMSLEFLETVVDRLERKLERYV